MKLNEITSRGSQKDWIEKFCNVRSEDISFNEETGLFDIETSVLINHPIHKFEAKIGVINGNLDFLSSGAAKNITTLQSFPQTIIGSFEMLGSAITSLEWLPEVRSGLIYLDHSNGITKIENVFPFLHRDISNLILSGSKIESLVGIDDLVKHKIERLSLKVSENLIGGIGLLLIPGLYQLTIFTSGFYAVSNGLDIIKKYLGRPEDIFDCQAELIEAGHANLAIL